MAKHKSMAVFDYSNNKLCDLYDSYISNNKGQAYDVTTIKE